VLEETAKWGIVDASRITINVVHLPATATAVQIQTMVNEFNILSVRLILVMNEFYLLSSVPSVPFILR
jgi:hypothetical protein